METRETLNKARCGPRGFLPPSVGMHANHAEGRVNHFNQRFPRIKPGVEESGPCAARVRYFAVGEGSGFAKTASPPPSCFGMEK